MGILASIVIVLSVIIAMVFRTARIEDLTDENRILKEEIRLLRK